MFDYSWFFGILAIDFQIFGKPDDIGIEDVFILINHAFFLRVIIKGVEVI